MTIIEALGEDFRNIILKDDDTAFGGVAFKGETLGDFINGYYPSINPATFDIDTLNKDLVECGIQPVGKCIDKEISR